MTNEDMERISNIINDKNKRRIFTKNLKMKTMLICSVIAFLAIFFTFTIIALFLVGIIAIFVAGSVIYSIISAKVLSCSKTTPLFQTD